MERISSRTLNIGLPASRFNCCQVQIKITAPDGRHGWLHKSGWLPYTSALDLMFKMQERSPGNEYRVQDHGCDTNFVDNWLNN